MSEEICSYFNVLGIVQESLDENSIYRSPKLWKITENSEHCNRPLLAAPHSFTLVHSWVSRNRSQGIYRRTGAAVADRR